MPFRFRFAFVIALALVTSLSVAHAACDAQPTPPNIIFIMADDLGYGDLGCYGQQRIRTPHIDRLAAEGMKFTDCYAGSTVCAPSRCCLMTGFHSGHAWVRGNARVPLRPADVTVAEVLKSAGYVTGMFGKWGLGEPDTTGIPNRQGFGTWFGYLNQHRAHNYYPDYLWDNQEKFLLPGNVVEKNVASQRALYSHDLCTERALAFLDRHRHERFFLYLPYTIPHANNQAGSRGMEVPSDAPYSDEQWPQQQRNHAAMITRLDGDVGRIMARLKGLGLEENTIVFFTSDNGPHREGGADPKFFNSSGPLRGHKRALYDGGIRVPMIVRWPGQVRAGAENKFAWAFWDFLPTAAELAGADAPEGTDGISVVPAIVGAEQAGRRQAEHDYLYWEFHEGGFKQAVRVGDFKGVRGALGADVEIYDLSRDIGEQNNLAAEHPRLVSRIEDILASARTESEHWPLRGR